MAPTTTPQPAAPDPAASERPAWPPPLIDVDLAVDTLREAIAAKVGSAPPFAFLRTVSPWDRALLDEEPREVVLPAALGRELMARRYGLYLLLNQKPAGPVRVDDEALRAVERQVGATLDGVQAVVAQLMSARDNAGTREATAVHAALARALGDVRTLADRLAGQAGGRALLDGDGPRHATFEMQSAKAIEPEKPKEPKFQRQDLDRGSPWPMRLALVAVAAVLGGVLVVRQLPKNPVKQWAPKESAEIKGVVSVQSRDGHAFVTVGPDWAADEAALAALNDRLRSQGVVDAVVVTKDGRAVAKGRTDGRLEVVAPRPPPPARRGG